MKPFRILALSFELEADQSLDLDELSGAVRMRGAFGLTFRRLVCPPPYWSRECRTCELWRACAYPTFFEPAPPEDAQRLRANADLPRPYVFSPGEKKNQFDLTLVGRGTEALPYFIVSLRELGAEGFGSTRRRFELSRVVARNGERQVVFSSSDRLVRSPHVSEVLLEIKPPSIDKPHVDRRTYRFLTPTILKAEGRVEQVPTYATLVKRARDRVNALATFFGAGAFEWDFQAIGEQANRVSTAHVEGGIRAHGRFSRRRGRAHDLSGFVGEVTYEGPSSVLSSFDPLLDLLDELHVGKGAAFGNGKVRRA